MKTHRCKKSLKERISIRNINVNGKSDWWLFSPDYDFDSFAYYLHRVAPICFCPFCGEKLKEK